jgi:hypothetical protein
MASRSPILSEDQIASLQHAREGIVSERLDRSRRVKDTSTLDACLEDIDRILADHQAALADMAGVSAHG